ncbi:MAG: undecaprenyl-diphosphate phosphatase [Clostridiales bacterium]|nr:undecaprenyl-diphosphate phosphatase [Clostridiales bacterium]
MEFIEIIKVIIIGIVEGITEWLPISSTAHMILVDKHLGLSMSEAFKDMFFVVIQLGAIMAVVVLYWRKIFPISSKNGLRIRKDIMSLWYKILVACIPAAVIGILFDDKIDELFNNHQTIAIALIVYGALFIIVENANQNRRADITELPYMTYKIAFLIGIFQVLALIPGTSRSGATIIGAMLLGASRIVSVEFTFLLAIPVMFGASLLKMLKFGFAFTGAEMATLLIGMIVAFIVSIMTIRVFINYIKKSDFKAFGWYRIVLGLVLILEMLISQ